MMEGAIFIGTSGWSYPHWRDLFYPPEFSREEWLYYYAKHFKTVEINNSFYQLPDRKTLLHWYDLVPRDFIFTVKASRYITHMKRLHDPEQSTDTFLERMRALEDKLGPILFQLPPHWHFNPERLSAFLDTLSNDFRYVFEFRDPSWHNTQTYQLLSMHKAAFCIFDLDGFHSPGEITTDFIYVRLHGPNGPYEGSYSKYSLSEWATTFANWSARGHTVYCYFDNTKSGYAAAQNALTLQTMLHSTQ